MSIEARLRDARFLYDNGRHEGALLMVLVAAAATSRVRRPEKETPDGEAFVKFMDEEGLGGCRVTMDGVEHPSSKFFYKFIRNCLVHEGTLHRQLVFLPPMALNEASIRSLCDNYPGKAIIEHPMVLVIGSAVASAKENVNLPAELQGQFWAM